MTDPVWLKARKKPLVVEFREVIGKFEMIETLAGALKVIAKDFYIAKGVKGEEYPIRKDIFYETFDKIATEKPSDEVNKERPAIVYLCPLDQSELKLIDTLGAVFECTHSQMYHKWAINLLITKRLEKTTPKKPKMVEILCDGVVHYRRPANHPDVIEMRKQIRDDKVHGYTIREIKE